MGIKGWGFETPFLDISSELCLNYNFSQAYVVYAGIRVKGPIFIEID